MFSQIERDPHRESLFVKWRQFFRRKKARSAYRHRMICSFYAKHAPRNENLLFKLYSVYSSLRQLFFQCAQRIASVTDGVLFLLRHLGKAFLALEFVGKKHRVVTKSPIT